MKFNVFFCISFYINTIVEKRWWIPSPPKEIILSKDFFFFLFFSKKKKKKENVTREQIFDRDRDFGQVG